MSLRRLRALDEHGPQRLGAGHALPGHGEDRGRDVLRHERACGRARGAWEILDGIGRLSYRRSALCFLDLRSGAPRVMAEPEADDLLEEAEVLIGETQP